MKKTLLTLLLGLILISCGQIKKHNMQKDAKEYLEVVLQAADTKTLNEIDGISILSVYLDSNVTIKKKSILQK